MALIGEIPSAFSESSRETRCHERCDDSDRSRCHSATSLKPATSDTGPPNDGLKMIKRTLLLIWL